VRGRLIRWGLPVVLVAVTGVGAAMAATASMHAKSATVKTVKSKTFGTILVASNGRTLYRYTLDRKRVNHCSSDATCRKYWPALLVKAGAKPQAGMGVTAKLLGTIKAAAGMRQVTYAGYPLYTFAGDKRAGQTAGQNFESEWYVVNTKGALVKHAVKAVAPPASVTTTDTSGGGGDAWG
jgi:predicted lipoprotein with Yx(FWY)xxD motif